MLESVQVRDRNQRLLIVAHRNEAESLALLRRKVAHHLNAADGSERPEQLPQNLVLCLRGQVVHEQAPSVAGAVAIVGSRDAVSQSTRVRLQWRIPARQFITSAHAQCQIQRVGSGGGS